jgi:transposase
MKGKWLRPQDYTCAETLFYATNRELDELLAINTSGFHQKERAFINRLQKHRQSIFTFLIYPNFQLNNNGLERVVRNVKVKTKVSGHFRNCEGKGTERFARIRSVIDTTIKNGQDVFFALKCMANIQITNST